MNLRKSAHRDSTFSRLSNRHLVDCMADCLVLLPFPKEHEPCFLGLIVSNISQISKTTFHGMRYRAAQYMSRVPISADKSESDFNYKLVYLNIHNSSELEQFVLIFGPGSFLRDLFITQGIVDFHTQNIL